MADSKSKQEKLPSMPLKQKESKERLPSMPLKQKESKKEDDLTFETFHHRSGKEFQCIYQSGMRFYLDDWGSKEWQPFPKRWYNEGLLVTNTVLKADGNIETNEAGVSRSNQSKGKERSQGSRQANKGTSKSDDDREGFIMHPSRGRITTYMSYKKHNVHMYYDKATGTWVRLPIGWELHHPMAKALVDQVEEAVPTLGDRHDILALLRACNYDPDECISIYMRLEGDEWLHPTISSKEPKTEDKMKQKVAGLQKQIRDLHVKLASQQETVEITKNKKTRPSVLLTEEFDDQNPFTEGNATDEVELQFKEGKSVFVSRAFLSYSSPIFANMFNFGLKETVDLKEKNYDAFLEMLLFLHPRVQQKITGENATAVYQMAKEYQIPTVMKVLVTPPCQNPRDAVPKPDKPSS